MSDDIRIDAGGLTDALSRIFEAAGGSAEEAREIAVNLVEATLKGHDSHGVIRTPRYVKAARDEHVFFGKSVQRVIDGPGFALLDGEHGFGQVLGRQSVEVGVEKAAAQGFAVVGLRRAGHLGRIGAWAELAVAEGLVSLHFVNVACSLLVSPFGGSERRMGTNPVVVGAPNGDQPIILDFATSYVAEGKVLVAQQKGVHAPDVALTDASGALTGDPAALYGEVAPGQVPDPRKGPGALAPMGGHKGSGLAFACEILAGALTGSGVCGPGEKVHNGMLSIYIDPTRLDDGHGYARTVADYVDYFRAARPTDPDKPVMVPGDPERARKADRLANGVPLPTAVWNNILDAGVSLGLDRESMAGPAEMGEA